MKKYIEQLSKEELIEVFNANEKLQAKVLDDMQDSEMYWISEKLDYVRPYLYDWSVGTDQHCYIKVKDSYEDMAGFLQGLKDMDAGVPAFSEDKAQEVIGKLEKVIEEYANADQFDESIDYLEEDAEAAVKEAAEELASEFESNLSYCYDSGNQLDYFLDFYVDSRMDEEETYYIIVEDADYKLYKDTVETF